MFAVKIGKELEKYRSRIMYAAGYLFSASGYAFRFLKDGESPRENEILFFYTGNRQSIGKYLSSNLRGFSICVLFDSMHYDYSRTTQEDIENNLKKMYLGYEIPYLCSRNLDEPVSIYKDKVHEKFYVGIFNFDLIGNIFFHLTSAEEEIIDNHDEHKRYLWQNSPFRKYYRQPFVSGLINLLELFLSEGEKYLPAGLIKLPIWPGNHQYAAVMSHSVDSLEKWTLKRFFTGIFDLFSSPHRIGYHFRNIGGFINFIFRNWEPYWNFDLVSKLEKKYGFFSTFFFGCRNGKKKPDVDYKLNEPDLIKQKRELVEAGHQLALLGNYNRRGNEEYDIQVKSLEEFAGRKIKGVRQHLACAEPNRNSFYYTNAGLRWDSSKTMIDMRGFVNGIGYPYFASRESDWQPTVLELPVNFSDQSLKTGKNSYMSQGAISEEIKDLIEQARKFQSLLVIDTGIASFEKIPFLGKLYDDILQKFKNDPTVWKTNLDEVYEWIEKRNSLSINVLDNKLVLRFGSEFKSLSLFIKGFWHVTEIRGRLMPDKEQEELNIFSENTWWDIGTAQIQVIGRMLELRNVAKGSQIELEIEAIGR